MRRIDATERRARLARRHRLAPGHAAAGPVEAARAVVSLHATDPVTVHLSARARAPGMSVADMERALYEDRSLVKHLAMRRTLWVIPRDGLPSLQAGASARVAEKERRRLIRDVERGGLHADGEAWLDGVWDDILEALSGGREATATELRAEIPALEGSLTLGEGRSWGGEFPVAPRVMTTISAAGLVLRASNDGGWSSSRPRWARAEDWLGAPIERREPAAGVAWLVREWLGAFGPGTLEDITWWLGSTVTAVRRALSDVDAVEVDLGGETGHLLPDDDEPVDPVEPWAALLPSLDPATMGWKERGWYLGPHRGHLFDRNGNAGHTVWWDGRIVGGWRQAGDGSVELQLLEDVGSDARAALAVEAERLTEWLPGRPLPPRFPAPLAKAP